jgi:hypothetical protein
MVLSIWRKKTYFLLGAVVAVIVWYYQCNHCLSPLYLWVRIPLKWGVLDTTIYEEVCRWLAAGWWFSPGTSISLTTVRVIVFNATFNNISVISWWLRKSKYPEKTTNLPQVTDKLLHILLYRVHLTWAGFELTNSDRINLHLSVMRNVN